MKTRQLICICFILLGLTSALVGCKLISFPHRFDQELQNVEEVQLLQYHYHTRNTTPIAILDNDVSRDLLTEITQLPCYRYFNDPSTDYGNTIIQITYSNGEGEIIGNRNSASISKDGKWNKKSYYFDSAQWDSVISKYLKTEDGSLS